MGTTRRDLGHGTRRAWVWVAMTALLAALLAACGASEVATSAPATAQAAATTVATNIPPGAAATVASAGTAVAANVPSNVAATAAAAATGVAPTVNAAASALQATPAASGPQATVTGEVTKAGPAARTFTVRGVDGKDYDFTASANSQVNLAALVTNLVSKQQVTVTYRGTAPPYEVISVR